MRNYSVKQVSVSFKWTFDRMLPALPGPSTPAFAALCKELHPYGLKAANILVEAPTARLSDVAIRLALMDEGLIIGLSLTELDLYCRDCYEEDVDVLVKIVEAFFVALKTIDEDIANGKASIKMSSQIQLKAGESQAFLQEHLTGAEKIPNLIPEAAAYKVLPLQNSAAKTVQVTIARSVVYEDSLFIEVAADYYGISDVAQLAKDANNDYERVIEMLSLNVVEGIGGE